VDKIEFEDGEFYCKTWLGNYLMSNTLVVSIAVGISLINILVKEIFRCKPKLNVNINDFLLDLSKFEGAPSKTIEILSSMFKLFVISFINTVRMI
jgi:hypothetical protein